MRIISGSHRGRHIMAPANLPVRPTTDLAKESLFNILNNSIDLEEVSVLDLFAGTGNISYEFASRGSKTVVAVDINLRCTDFIKRTAAMLNFDAIQVIKSNVFGFLKFANRPYDIIFADPPYDMENISLLPDLIFQNNLLNDNGLLIIEHSKDNDFALHPNFSHIRNYGKVNFSFFENKNETDNPELIR